MRFAAILVAALAIATGAMPASALSFDFSYNSIAGNFEKVFAAGTLTTTDTPDADGFYGIIGISGTRNGAIIDELVPAGTLIDFFTSPDNLFNPSAPFLTGNGFAFGVAGSDLLYNPYFDAGSGNHFEYVGGDLRFNTIDFPAGVPEPATWAMMMIGFGAVGGVLRRMRVTTAHAATA